MIKLKEKIRKFFSYRTISIVVCLALTLSLVPLLYCSFFDYATGDDLWEGAVAYQILQRGGSVRELFQSVFSWIKAEYYGWEGNWSSIFLWCFSPNVFGEKIYCITPWIGILSICLGHWYCFHHFNKKYFGLKNEFFLIVYGLVTLCALQYMPYIRGGIFWYSSMINYTFPYGLTMAIFVWIDKYLETGKHRYFIFMILALTFLGGSGYLAIVLNFEVFILVIGYHVFESDKIKKKRGLLLSIPLILLLIGFIISALSPGNAIRGGDSYGFSISNILYTLKECVVQGTVGIPTALWNAKLMIVVFPLIVIGTWQNLDLKKTKLKFRYPLFMTIFLFLISCSVYAPGIYANDELSGGVYDTIFFVFVLFYFCAIIYLTGCLKARCENGKLGENLFIEKSKIIVMLVTVLVCIVGFKWIVNYSAAKVCMDFIVSGQLEDFENQMQERLAILNDPIVEEVIVPEMNNEQGPFMHMPLTDDPNHYTNMATARYYGKKSVVAVPRDEYYERFGEKK